MGACFGVCCSYLNSWIGVPLELCSHIKCGAKGGFAANEAIGCFGILVVRCLEIGRLCYDSTIPLLKRFFSFKIMLSLQQRMSMR